MHYVIEGYKCLCPPLLINDICLSNKGAVRINSLRLHVQNTPLNYKIDSLRHCASFQHDGFSLEFERFKLFQVLEIEKRVSTLQERYTMNRIFIKE